MFDPTQIKKHFPRVAHELSGAFLIWLLEAVLIEIYRRADHGTLGESRVVTDAAKLLGVQRW